MRTFEQQIADHTQELQKGYMLSLNHISWEVQPGSVLVFTIKGSGRKWTDVPSNIQRELGRVTEDKQ